MHVLDMCIIIYNINSEIFSYIATSMSEQPPPSYGQASNPAPATVGQPPVQQTAGVAQPQVFWKAGPDGQPQMFYSASPGLQPLFQPSFQAVPYMPVGA